jgi:hypothetical protein
MISIRDVVRCTTLSADGFFCVRAIESPRLMRNKQPIPEVIETKGAAPVTLRWFKDNLEICNDGIRST